MKDSWRAGIPEKDRTQLVLTGVYQISRNPAFLEKTFGSQYMQYKKQVNRYLGKIKG